MRPDRLRRLRRLRDVSLLLFVALSLIASGFIERGITTALSLWAVALVIGAFTLFVMSREERASR